MSPVRVENATKVHPLGKRVMNRAHGVLRLADGRTEA
jgi:hypothetical protein